MVAALGGLDVLVFTGGVGENAPAIRQRLCADLTHLGVMVDSEANDAVEGDTEISGPRTAARTLVIVAREDLEVVRQVRQVLVRVGPPAWPATQDS
jgi:acetate kinase